MKIAILTRSYSSIWILINHLTYSIKSEDLIVFEYSKRVPLKREKYNILQRIDITLYRVFKKFLNYFSQKKTKRPDNITLIRINELSEIIPLVSEKNIDILLLKNAPIISKKLIDALNICIVNGHSGYIPYYKGANCGLWPVINKDNRIGVTLHEVTNVLDGGKILRRSLINLESISKGLMYSIDINNEQQKTLAEQFIDYIEFGEKELMYIEEDTINKYYSLPGFTDYIRGVFNIKQLVK